MHRVVQYVDAWSVAKVATVVVACGYVITMISSYLLWQAAERAGTLDGIEGFMEDTGGYDVYVIDGSTIFRTAVGVGFVLSLALVAAAILGALLFNLISDLTGGIRMTVIDEDLIVTPASRVRPDPSFGDASAEGPAVSADPPSATP